MRIPALNAGEMTPRQKEVHDAIAAKRERAFTAADERIFYQFSMELLRNHFVSEKTFKAAQQQFGTQGAIDIVACIGHFSMLAMALNAFLVDLKEPPPFADIGTRPYEESLL
jgi:4-carboxymuconolactone decarboxylase